MNGNWLPLAHLTVSGRPVLQPREAEISRPLSISSPRKPLASSPSVPVSSPSLRIASYGLLDSSRFRDPRVTAEAVQLWLSWLLSQPEDSCEGFRFRQGTTGEEGSKTEVITIVMRGKNDPDAFFGKLLDVLRSRSWEIEEKNGEVASLDGRERGRGPGDGPDRAGIAMP